MNLRLLIRIVGLLLALIGVAMASCWAFAVAAQETQAAFAFSWSAGATFGAGLLLAAIGFSRNTTALRKEGIAIVGVGWLACALFGALPFMLCEPQLSFFDAFFESMSGFSTTGATVINDIEAIPRSLALWRSIAQWLGGLGILVLFVALLSTIGVGSKALFRHESSASASESPQTRIRNTALQLWAIYVALSGICCLGLRSLGMDWYDAVNHAMTTIATGGFSTHTASVAYFDSWAIEMWMVVFMLLGSVNFLLYAGALEGRKKHRRREEELPIFLAIWGVATLFVAVNLVASPEGPSIGASFRQAVFQVTSIVTTSGFTTEDYESWPGFSVLILFALMVIGGCGGSTSGGIKINRWILFAKITRVQIVTSFRPNQIISLKVNGATVSDQARAQTAFYIALAATTAVIGALCVSALEPTLDLVTIVSVTFACLFNLGPALGEAGPVESYSELRPLTKMTLSLLMAVGRLEFFAILALFTPKLWRKY